MAAASPYLIASASNPTFVADLEGSGEGRNISLYERHTHANQRWIPERISPGVYAFRSAVKNIKTYIHAPGPTSQLRGSTEDPTKNQASQWRLIYAGDKFENVIIQNVLYRDAMGAQGDSSQNLDPIKLQSTLHQWRLLQD